VADGPATLLLVHAHPDDESIATGGVILRATDAGRRVVLVTCTRGEEGEIHNLDPASARPRLAEIRETELRRACTMLGVQRLELLGYRDSGMAGAPSNRNPSCFHRAPVGEAAARLVTILRQERPQVVVSYTADGTYGHPDHVKAHLVTAAALALLLEEGWRPARVYWHAVPRSRASLTRQQLGVRAHRSMTEVGVPDDAITTAVDVGAVLGRKFAAVAAHVSQNPRNSLSAMLGQVLSAMGTFEHFVRRDGALATARCEDDLLAGIPTTGGGSTPRPVRPPPAATASDRPPMPW
jgi:N-acetyl-1-D-myo-inositol-2-amino-2-deoxy-alpha-D-glucopyranoside deacetylase